MSELVHVFEISSAALTYPRYKFCFKNILTCVTITTSTKSVTFGLIKQWEIIADHSPPSIPDIWDTWSITSIFLIRCNGVLLTHCHSLLYSSAMSLIPGPRMGRVESECFQSVEAFSTLVWESMFQVSYYCSVSKILNSELLVLRLKTASDNVCQYTYRDK
jgi:hypothetical protein